MGEQTQIQAQTQTQSQSNQSQPNSDPTTTSTSSQSQPSVATETPNDLSQNPSNASKIPIRPQKIRKLSSNTSVDTPEQKPQITDSSSSQSLVIAPISTATATATSTTRARRRNPCLSSKSLPKVIKPLSADGEIELALRHLRAADPLIATLIDTHPPPTFESHHSPFLALAKSILYQQLAYKAGTSIYTRFIALCGGEDHVLPDTVLSLSSQQLKQIGVSGRKASYLYDLSNKYKNGILSDDSVVKMDDRSLFTMLSMVKGIGSWSVHMFMIFSLHRPDVLPVSDLGVRKGVQLLHGMEDLPRPSQMEQLCEKWMPYRSVGAWYMWRLVEGKGNPNAGVAVSLEGSGVLPLQQIEPLQEAQQQHQLQLLEPINGIGNLG
ncbi:unnamed protein product [Ilex paraguariensis]|uniref:HhH-GPD domain-containing protein n=1 Tax=Ilex paraguariensis TaxID=185542 RepID=A0ABC8S618_9AQUA